MDKSTRKFCREFEFYQQSKVNKLIWSPIQNFKLPSPDFQTVHIDIVRPLTSVLYLKSYNYILNDAAKVKTFFFFFFKD